MSFDTSQDSYTSLRSIIAERTDRMLAWIGSGLSVRAGLPDWKGLRKILEDALLKKTETLEPKDALALKNTLKMIKSMKDMWTVFELLNKHLGDTTWRATIKESLSVATTKKTPKIYQDLWKLKLHGILTLNLDRFAGRSYAETFNEQNLIEFSGKQVGNYTYVLKNPRKFVCDLHGNIDDVSSWILTKSELKSLLDNQAYNNFINSCLSSSTIVFLGMSVDDVSVGSFCQRLTTSGIDFGNHFWITDRRDKETDKFAEKIGIRIIRYNSSENNHSELDELLKDLYIFVSPEDPILKQPAFINPCEIDDLGLPSPEEIKKLDTENIRKILNNQAVKILSNSSTEAYKEYEEFLSKYDEAVYRSWYTSLQPRANILCGYKLEKRAAKGAFGTVFKASSPSGDVVAIKLMHEQIRNNPDLLQSFRRGVHSMSILSTHNIEGMVAYRDASEIPAFVVMDWINGPSVTDAIQSKSVTDWKAILKIASDASSIIRKGHLLPERVLHRDIRPSNIMLKDFYIDQNRYEIVVLDFDLSWYRGSYEKSIVYGSTMMGYLSPEQIQSKKGISTRNTAVDSFGLGMTLFFMCSGRDPVPDEHLHLNWIGTVYAATKNLPSCSLSSIPNRFARLILKSTRHDQKDRWDMAQLEDELQRMFRAVVDPNSIESAEILAEEIAAKCVFMENYIWDDDRLSAKKENPSGIQLNIIGDETNQKIRIELIWGLPGVHGQGEGVGKWLPKRMEAATSLLKKGGWELEQSDKKWANVRINASIKISQVKESFEKVLLSIQKATDEFRF